MAGKYLRGAFVQFMPTFLIPLPNVVIFQYNPEKMTHAWSPAPAADSANAAGGNPLATKGPPGETFNFSLVLNSDESIADGSVSGAIAEVSGVASRLAALETLMFPVDDGGGGLLGSVSVSIGAGGISASAGGEAVDRKVPGAQLPTVLFVWGPGRIVPVRVTSLSTSELIYDGLLNPTRAEVQVGLQVLTPDELAGLEGPLKPVAKMAYEYTNTLRKALAVANLGNAVESIIGMLPV